MILKIYKKCLLCLSLSLCLLFFTYLLAYLLPKVSIGESLTIQFVDERSSIIYESNHELPSSWINIEEVSPSFMESLIAIEDQRFYHHQGIDFYSLLRASLINMKEGKIVQGASTITQQYARILLNDYETSWLRKLKEAFMALRLEMHYDKETILEAYINIAYFGNGIYGIKNASHYYFNKKPSQLTYSESALLAGILDGPETYTSLDKLYERRNLVLKELYLQGYMNELNYQDYLNETILFNHPEKVEDATLNYFCDYIFSELSKLDLDLKGIKVYTTLDLDIQKTLTKTIETNMPSSHLQVSSIIVEPYTSKILALAGGKNYQESPFNRAINASRECASTIKPLLYYLALNNGFQPNTTFLSEPTTFYLNKDESYHVHNYGNLYAYEKIPLSKAIALSDNIYALKTHLFLGSDTLCNTLVDFGFEDIENSPSLALGQFSTNIYELANIYTIFASSGYYQPLYGIERIEDLQGNILYTHENLSIPYFDETSCLILNQLLTAPFEETYTSYSNATLASYKPTRTFAAKTGTSDYDSLVLGYCPDLLIGCWVGYDTPRILYDQEKRVSKQIFYDLAQTLTQHDQDLFYQPNENITSLTMNIHTGELSRDGLTYWFRNN